MPRVPLWIIIALIATVICFLTGNVLLGIMPPFLEVAWQPMRSAFWLRKMDPIRARGKTLFWFYLGAGVMRAACVAFLIVILLSTFVDVARLGKKQVEPLEYTVMTLLGSIFVSSIFGMIGTALALYHRGSVFVIPSLCELCDKNIDNLPIIILGMPYKNSAVPLVALSVMVPSVFCGLFLGVITDFWLNQGLKGAGMIWSIVFPLLMIPLYAYLCNHIIAPSPIYCW